MIEVREEDILVSTKQCGVNSVYSDRYWDLGLWNQQQKVRKYQVKGDKSVVGEVDDVDERGLFWRLVYLLYQCSD